MTRPAEPHPTLTAVLPRSREAGGEARRLVEAHLADLGSQDLGDVLTVASELVNNAVQHGEGRIELRIGRHDERIRIEVIDEGDGDAVAIRDAAGSGDGGFGLRMVDRLASDWGAFDGSTHVWADLPVAPPDLKPR